QLFEAISSEEQRGAFEQELGLDFAYAARGIGRFRVNAYLQGGTLSLVFLLIRTEIPTIEEFGLPAICKTLALKPNGLVVITGPTGSGKSTTLAAMMEYLNQNAKKKIITIEDPVEFVFQDKKCMFSQRELGRDARSFAVAVKQALRQNPDVIMVGEMRDLETIAATITAAETGHLVLATLHTPGAPQAVDRIIDVFPAYQQQQVRTQLSVTLEGVLYQNLVPMIGGSGRVVAMEVMMANVAIKRLIREGKTHQMLNAIQTGAEFGMQTLDQALFDLAQKKIISKGEAIARSRDPEEMERMLLGGGSPRNASPQIKGKGSLTDAGKATPNNS
ncbi:MAG: PilT/PilU family type 4a pilus ATPase, partial [Dehalococcoidia bacterium]